MSIKKFREAKNISQVDFARKVGVTQGMVSLWEKGDFLPRAEKLPMIAEILGCSIDDILRKDES